MVFNLMITGHRPGSLYDGHADVDQAKLSVVESVLRAHDAHPDLVLISGMALGPDTWLARVAAARKIPFVAVIPFAGQESRWSRADQTEYRRLLGLADKVVTVASVASRQAFLDRNLVMVDMADEAIAVWNGSASGTGYTVAALRRAGIRFEHVRVGKARSDA